MRIFVTGGAGYVGSHTVRLLVDRGHDVVVYDSLRRGHRQAVPRAAKLVEADLLDRETLRRALSDGRFDAVMHFAALSLVGESMHDPFGYLHTNFTNALDLIRATVESGIGKFVLSSTANLFGSPDVVPIPEDARIDPGSPYGESKYLIERALHWADRIHGLRSACLRYFNAAGAHPDGSIGEWHEPETHLIPIVLEAALGARSHVDVFGDDYATPDGTCIRDYVHVCDLADAHVRVLDALAERSCRYNVGNGHGYSVREVIETARKVTGRPIEARIGPRRPGDPPVLVAASDLIRRELGWAPAFPKLEAIVSTAWAWHSAHPRGYGTLPGARRAAE